MSGVDPWQNARGIAQMSGTLMRQGRTHKKISQAELARQLDPDGEHKWITVPNISRVENGELIPPPDVAMRIHEWVLQARPGYELRYPTPARATDPETSHRAAPSTNTQVHWGLTEVLRMYPNGLPDFKLEPLYNQRSSTHPQEYPRVTPQRLRTARHELIEAGRVVDTGKTELNARFRACTIWRYVPDGPH